MVALVLICMPENAAKKRKRQGEGDGSLANMICKRCGIEAPAHVERCHVCGQDVGFPNVRAAESVEEINALAARLTLYPREFRKRRQEVSRCSGPAFGCLGRLHKK
jgi:hypothetical protein